MDLLVLANELSTDPLGRGYSDLSPADTAADLNEERRSLVDTIPAENLLLWSAAGGRLQKLLSAAELATNSVALRSAARALYTAVTAFQGVDPSDSRWATLVNFLVDNGPLSAADRTALVTEATETVSRATELGLPEVKPGHVIKARARIS